MLMFGRIQQLLEGGGELFRAEAELASKRVKAALVSSVILLVSMLVLALGVAVVLAGLTMQVADAWGWPLALGAVGSALAVVGIGLWMFANAKSAGVGSEPAMEAVIDTATEEPSTPRQDAEEAKDKMKDAVTPDTDKPKEGESLTDELENLKHAAVDLATRNPMVVGSAALLAVSLFGPGRTIKLISRAVAAAGLAASALDVISGEKPESEEEKDATTPERPRSDRKRSHQPRPRSFESRMPLTPPYGGERPN